MYHKDNTAILQKLEKSASFLSTWNTDKMMMDYMKDTSLYETLNPNESKSFPQKLGFGPGI